MDRARLDADLHPSTGGSVDEAVFGHIIHFYSGDDELVANVVAHLVTALESGGTALAIATEVHRAAFATGLAELGIKTDALKRLRIVDAEETLQRFLVDGELDADRFNEVVGELVGSSEAPVHAFGEMVAILWGSGRIQEAIDLEILWNALGERYPFVLLCGYPDESCLWDEQANALAQVCGFHGSVTGSAAPPEPRATGVEEPTDAEHVLRLPRERSSVRTARAHVREVFTDLSIGESDVAELLVSELATNAFEHGDGEMVVQIVVRDRSVTISVSDDDPTEPVRKYGSASSPRRRGLQIVEALSIRWGVTPRRAGGKTVWAELERTVPSSIQR